MDTIPAKKILSGYRDGKEWFGSHYSMNLYKGCCHGCIYCDSRSECYQIDCFDQVRVKENALELLAKELPCKRQSGVVETGGMNDPYNPFEAQEEITRGALELLNRFLFGVSVTTKSALVIRDIGLFQQIQRHSPVIIKLTVTTCQDSLSRLVEPNVCSSGERFQAIRELSQAGLYTGVLMMPLLPFLEDNEDNVRGIIRAAAENGAQFVYPSFGVTLRMNQRDYFYERLDELFPGMKQRYVNTYGDSYYCESPAAQKLWRVFREECHSAGLAYRMQDIIDGYQASYQAEQLSLF